MSMSLKRPIQLVLFSILAGWTGSLQLRADTAPAVSLPDPPTQQAVFSQWKKSLPASNDFFPIAVWLQSPHNAKRYKDIGINTYISIWQGPTEAQLVELEKNDMKLICEQNEMALKNISRGIIVGWMQKDEPDNAQAIRGTKKYGPPVEPKEVEELYNKMRAADPDRPVFLNLSMGVAWDGWYGRGVRTKHPEDYPLYSRGADILGFDIYPASAPNREIAGKLELVPYGVDRLRQWSGNKMVWCCIETTKVDNLQAVPDPVKTRAETWLAIIHGARGLIYFSHEFKPKFVEAGLLADSQMAASVGAVNKIITSLAPVIHSPSATNAVQMKAVDGGGIDVMVKRHGGALYLFAASYRSTPTPVTFELGAGSSGLKAEVIGEDRTVTINSRQWQDSFDAYGVHIYKIAEK